MSLQHCSTLLMLHTRNLSPNYWPFSVHCSCLFNSIRFQHFWCWYWHFSTAGERCSVEIWKHLSVISYLSHCTDVASWTSLLSHKLQICLFISEQCAVWSPGGWYGVCLREEEERPVTPPLVLLTPLTGRQALFRSRSFSQGSYCGRASGYFSTLLASGIIWICWWA